MRLEWKEEYSVKVKEIDEQHKKLFTLLNETDETIHNGEKKEIFIGILNRLSEYAKYHFETEEKYFDKFNYPDSKEHKESHDQYEGKIQEFENKIQELAEEELLDFYYEILDFLEDWWVGHILYEDMRYSQFFNEHGLK